MIEFNNVVIGSFGPLSFSAGATEWRRICLPNADVRDDLTACLLGQSRPLAGSVTIMGKDIYEITEEEFILIFKNIGVVTEGGDMISNLRLWENMILPAWYQDEEKIEEIEERLLAMLKEPECVAAGLSALLSRAPAELTQQQRRIASFIRGHLFEPNYILYCGLTDSMNQAGIKSTQKAIIRLRRPEQGALFITSEPEALGDVTVDGDIDVKC